METDGVPEVQPSGQDINPIVVNPALVIPLTDLKSPGDSMVPLDPEESGSDSIGINNMLYTQHVVLFVSNRIH